MASIITPRAPASDLCSAFSSSYVVEERAIYAGYNYVFTFYKTSGGIIYFTFVNKSDYAGGIAIALHVMDGTGTSGNGVLQTDCIAYNQIDLSVFANSLLPSGILGTKGHATAGPTSCATRHTSDATQNRWGYVP